MTGKIEMNIPQIEYYDLYNTVAKVSLKYETNHNYYYIVEYPKQNITNDVPKAQIDKILETLKEAPIPLDILSYRFFDDLAKCRKVIYGMVRANLVNVYKDQYNTIWVSQYLPNYPKERSKIEYDKITLVKYIQDLIYNSNNHMKSENDVIDAVMEYYDLTWGETSSIINDMVANLEVTRFMNMAEIPSLYVDSYDEISEDIRWHINTMKRANPKCKIDIDTVYEWMVSIYPDLDRRTLINLIQKEIE